MSRSDICRQDVKLKYEEMFKKKEQELAKIDPETRAKLEASGADIEAFKPLKIDEVADEIDRLRNKITDPMKFRSEANKLLADMQAERVNKKVDFYLKQMQDISLKNKLITDNPVQTLKNIQELFDIQLDNRINHLSSKNVSLLEQMFDEAEKNILSKNDPNTIKQIYNAIEGYDLDNISEQVINIAKKIKSYYDYLHKQQIDAGFRLGYLTNYSGKRTYDGSKIRANKEQAIKDLMDSIDVAETFPHLDLRLDADQAEFRKIAERIIDDRIEADITVGSMDVGKMDSSMRSSLEARQTRERKLKFKAGKEGEWAVKYGKNSLLENLVGSARTVAKVSANRELLGVNPRATMDAVVNAARKKFADDPKFMRATDKGYLEKLWSPYNGTLGRLGSSTYSTEAEVVKLVADNIKSYIYMTKLGKTMISALVDLPTAAVVLDSATGQGLLKSFSDIMVQALADSPTAFAAYFKGKVPDNVRLRAQELGVFMEAGVGEALKRAGVDGTGTRGINKLLAISDRINPIGKQTSFHDFTALMAYQNAFAKMINLKETPEEILISMSRVGMNKDYVNILKGLTDTAKGTEGSAIVFSPNKINELSDADLKVFKDKIGQTDPKIQLMSVKEFRTDMNTKIQMLFDDFRNTAIPKPSGSTKRTLTIGQAGDIKSELLNSLTMLKSFSFKMLEVQQRIWNSSTSMNKKITRSVAFATSLTGAGYVVGALKDIASNRTPKPLDDAETYKDAFLMGGAGGIYADLFFSAADADYNNFTKGLVGPMAQPVEDVISLASKTANTVFGGKARTKRDKNKKLQKKDLKKVYKNLPFQNHLLLRPMLDYMFLDAHMKAIDPEGYKRNLRSLRQKGQKPLR